MKSALVYFTEISRTIGHVGGSEMLLFLMIQELQGRGYDVTVALQSGGDVVAGSKDYGTEIDVAALKVVHLSEGGRFLRLLDRHLKFLWQWRLRRLGPKYDVCISCANVVDFGRPGVHFIYMLTLDEAFKEHFWKENTTFIRRARLWCVCARDAMVKALFWVRSVAKIVQDTRETVLSNSEFVRKCIEDYYKCKIHAAFYPPTMFESGCVDPGENFSRVERVEACRGGGMEGCADIACIGRLAPEKRICSLIDIVREARKRSGVDFKVRFAGKCPETDNGREIKALAEKYDWVRLEGTLYGAAKAAFLASCKFALHGCKVEAFGISITEYLKAGLVPVVPQEGGSSEVVGLDDLVYGSDDEATEILARLATDEVFYRKCQAHCTERGKEFSAAAYMNRQKELMDELGI